MKLKKINNLKNNVYVLAKNFIGPQWFYLGAFFYIFLSLSPAHSQDVDFNSLIQQSRQKKLAQTLKWRRLLYIPDRWYPSDVSLVDDPKFFLSPKGKKSPQQELEATLEHFVHKRLVRDRMAHCLFPARYKYLDKELNLKKYGVDLNQCQDLQKFLKFADYNAVSLVFSSYFINSPGSMFGHTLFRLHRNNKTKRSDLLDDSINFSAFVAQFNALLYPFQGLLGHFKGRFAMLPYYKKIQEYNNQESRDVWEYKLNLTQEEVDELVLVMVEIGEVYFDYYYLDDNCSYIILTLLEAIRPSLQLTKHYTMYAIPGDTLRTVYQQQNFVTDIVYRPSSMARYLLNYENLSSAEKNLFQSLISHKSLEGLTPENCNKDCRVKVYDTAIEYIDYDEKVIGLKQADKYKNLRRELLLKRAELKIKSPQLPSQPLTTPAHLGHSSNLIALYGGTNSKNTSFLDFQWRPAMHDITSHELGYSNEMQVEFLNLNFRLYENRLQLKKVHFLDLTSLPKSYPLIKTSAWSLNFGYEEKPYCENNREYCKRTNITFGKGLTQFLFNNQIMLYEFLKGDLIFSNIHNRRANFSPALSLGAMYDRYDHFKLNGQIQYRAPLVKDLSEELELDLIFTYFINESNEIKLLYHHIHQYDEYLLGYRRYL